MIPRVLIRVPRVFVEYNESFLPCCGWNYSLLGAVTPTRRSPAVRWLLVRIPQAGFLAVGFIYREFILGRHLFSSGGISFCVLGGALLPSCVFFFCLFAIMVVPYANRAAVATLPALALV